MTPWLAALIALFLWWFSTGAILWLVKTTDRLGERARRLAVLATVPLFGLGLLAYVLTLGDATVGGVYIAFLSALAIWGWIELAFLAGIITGPITKPCPPDIPEWERFLRAWGTIAYHEMLLVTALIVLTLYGWGAENIIGMWTFIILFFARVSAKLNLYFGVPRINTEFLPTTMAHLPSHFRVARINWVFPISITALSFAVACWLERLWAATTTAEAAGFALLTAITALALLEHWLMVIPLPDERLWRWMLPATTQQTPNTQVIKTQTEDAHGL